MLFKAFNIHRSLETALFDGLLVKTIDAPLPSSYVFELIVNIISYVIVSVITGKGG